MRCVETEIGGTVAEENQYDHPAGKVIRTEYAEIQNSLEHQRQNLKAQERKVQLEKESLEALQRGYASVKEKIEAYVRIQKQLDEAHKALTGETIAERIYRTRRQSF